MDLVRFKEGILSFSGIDLIISIVFLSTSYLIKDILLIEPELLPLITILCLINIVASAYFIYEGMEFYKIKRMDKKQRARYGWRFLVVGLVYIGNIIFHIFFLFQRFVEIIHILLYLLLFCEIGVSGVAIREGYDLIWGDEIFFEKYEKIKRM